MSVCVWYVAYCRICCCYRKCTVYEVLMLTIWDSRVANYRCRDIETVSERERVKRRVALRRLLLIIVATIDYSFYTQTYVHTHTCLDNYVLMWSARDLHCTAPSFYRVKPFYFLSHYSIFEHLFAVGHSLCCCATFIMCKFYMACTYLSTPYICICLCVYTFACVCVCEWVSACLSELHAFSKFVQMRFVEFVYLSI